MNNKLKKQAEVRESVLAIIVMLAICYMAYSIFYSPKKTRSEELTVQISEIVNKKTGIQKLNRALQKSYELQKEEMVEHSKMKESLDPKIQMIKNYENSVFEDMAELLTYVASDDFKAGVEINRLKYDVSAGHKGYKSTKFFLNVSGRFGSITEFIGRLEGIPALLTLDRVDLKVNARDSNMVNLDIDGTFYELGKDNG